MELYSFFQSSTSYRVRIALNLKGLSPQMHYVNLTKGEHRADEYAKLNPSRIVPTLRDGDTLITQSLAIMEYLDEAYPNTPKLLPGDAVMRAYIRALSLGIAADISPLGNLKVRQYLQRGLNQTEDVVIEFIRHWIHEGFAAMEEVLSASAFTGKFCVGDSPTMADCCLIPQLFAANRWKVDLAPYPTIRRISSVCEVHPAFLAAHPSNQADSKS